MSNPAHAQMSDEEAKIEHDNIQAEIAKEKGLEPAKDEQPEEKKEVPEKEEEKEPAAKADEGKPHEEEKPDDVKDVDEKEPEAPTRNSRHIPLSKYQELKKELRETTSAKDTEIANLKSDLEAAKSNKELGTVVKTFAEKHNVSEEFATDMLEMAKAAMPKADDSQAEVLKKAEVLVKKQEAIEAFENEFTGLLKDVPNAAELKDQIRQEAYKEGNLDRSLFEIYHRMSKSDKTDAEPPKKRGAEVSRGPSSARNNPPSFDPKQIADRYHKGETGVMKGLSGEQQDQVFDYMEKNGSRYSK